MPSFTVPPPPKKKNIYIYIFKGDAKFLLKGGLILRGFNEKKRSN